MLCERCEQRQANNHLTIVVHGQGETEHHLCDSCYAEFAAHRMESLPTSTPTPLPEDLRLVTAKDFIQITERATANAVEMPGYKRFLEKLFAVPEVRERLAFEGMAIAWDSLSAGTE